MTTHPSDPRLAVIGLGYVGLPLAVEFGRQLDTLGYDIDAPRIDRWMSTNAPISGRLFAPAR